MQTVSATVVSPEQAFTFLEGGKVIKTGGTASLRVRWIENPLGQINVLLDDLDDSYMLLACARD